MKKISPKSLKEISNILKEETNFRKNAQKSMYENKKNSLMNESLMFEEDSSGLQDAPKKFIEDINDDITNHCRDLVPEIRTIIYKSLASYMKLSGIVNMTPNAWMDELEAFDSYEDEMEMATDISDAVMKYAEKVIKNAVTVVGPPEDEDV